MCKRKEGRKKKQKTVKCWVAFFLMSEMEMVYWININFLWWIVISSAFRLNIVRFCSDKCEGHMSTTVKLDCQGRRVWAQRKKLKDTSTRNMVCLLEGPTAVTRCYAKKVLYDLSL